MATLITLSCPSCGARIEMPEDSNRLTCGYCGNQHLLQANDPPAPGPTRAAKPKAIRPRVPLQKSIKILRDNDSARIVRRWWTPAFIPVALFAFVWDAFLIFWYSIAISSGAPVIFVVFPLFHLGVGLAITYYTLAGFLNRTVVELNREELSVWHEPLLWTGEKTIKTADIKQLYCKQRVKRTKSSQQLIYELYAVTQDDYQVKLLDNLDSPDLAQFFEQQLETWLRIKDHPVVGEIAK